MAPPLPLRVSTVPEAVDTSEPTSLPPITAPTPPPDAAPSLPLPAYTLPEAVKTSAPTSPPPTTAPTPPPDAAATAAVYVDPLTQPMERLADSPLVNKLAVEACPSWLELRVQNKGLVTITGGQPAYSVKTGWEFGALVYHKDVKKQRFLAGTVLVVPEGDYVFCWGPIDDYVKNQKLALFRLNRVQAFKGKGLVPAHFGSAEAFIKEFTYVLHAYYTYAAFIY
eukprot:gene11862-14006_t